MNIPTGSAAGTVKRTSVEIDFGMCEVCGKDGRPGHDCDGGEALRKAARELFGPAMDLVERVIAKAGTGVLRGVFEVAFERDALRAQLTAAQSSEERLKQVLRKVQIELRGVGPESSREFHRIGIESALGMLKAALSTHPSAREQGEAHE